MSLFFLTMAQVRHQNNCSFPDLETINFLSYFTVDVFYMILKLQLNVNVFLLPSFLNFNGLMIVHFVLFTLAFTECQRE